VRASFYRDSALDQQWAWDTVRGLRAERVIVDGEIRAYFLFRSGFQPAWRLESPQQLSCTVPLGSVVVAGGARKPGMFTGYAEKWAAHSTPKSDCLVAQAPFSPQPWRPTAMKVYLVASKSCVCK
jgi:hypothetical protein